MDMRRGELYMHASVFPLRPSKAGAGFAGLSYRKLSDYPRGVRPTLSVRLYLDLADAYDTWVSKPGHSSDELRVARAAVLNNRKNVPMRVMNVAE